MTGLHPTQGKLHKMKPKLNFKLAKSETPFQQNPDTHREKEGGEHSKKREPGTIRTRPSVLLPARSTSVSSRMPHTSQRHTRYWGLA